MWWTFGWGNEEESVLQRWPSHACGVVRIPYCDQSVAQAEGASRLGPDRLSLGLQPQTMWLQCVGSIGLKTEMQIKWANVSLAWQSGELGSDMALLYGPRQVTQAVQWNCSHAGFLLNTSPGCRIGPWFFFYFLFLCFSISNVKNNIYFLTSQQCCKA